MNRAQATHLCVLCDLGELLADPQAVTGGMLHRMWRLNTTRGLFAVKQLNPAIMRKPNIQHEYRVSEAVAQAMAKQGIPAVAALQCAGGLLQEVDGAFLLAYPWIDGEILSSAPVEPDRARQIGITLAHMHMLSLSLPEVAPLEWKHFHSDDWDILTFQAADVGLPWVHSVRAVLPMLLQWTQSYEDAGEKLMQQLVVSQRDLDQKNVIWQTPTAPKIIDWEAAGLINPAMELIGVALSWSGFVVGAPDKEIFTTLIDAYKQAGGTIQNTGLDALHGLLGTWLGWLLFNMRRSLGESITSEDERRLGIRETINTLAILRSLATHTEEWAQWLDER
ncbi:MAG: aminoglycoside phosphotransferase family protein [Ktedonobacteraceae bacterium]|nr:aminoglycoside phosphotransferase family protein [Ktedonobacteraceae bacterium]